MIKKTDNTNYTEKDKKCTHCGGEIQPHCCGTTVKYWCEKCGSNDKKTPPNIKINIG